jgi:hypothetical protein
LRLPATPRLRLMFPHAQAAFLIWRSCLPSRSYCAENLGNGRRRTSSRRRKFFSAACLWMRIPSYTEMWGVLAPGKGESGSPTGTPCGGVHPDDGAVPLLRRVELALYCWLIARIPEVRLPEGASSSARKQEHTRSETNGCYSSSSERPNPPVQ